MTTTHRARIAGLVILLASLAVAAGYAADRWRGAFYVALIAFLLVVFTYIFDRCTEPPQEKNARHAKGSR
jgi:uncharacterized protein (DUF58 family)